MTALTRSDKEQTVVYLTEEKKLAYNVIRVFACLSVILVHVAMLALNSDSATNPLAWWSGNVYEALARSGITLFLMLTGALLLPKADAGIGFFTDA